MRIFYTHYLIFACCAPMNFVPNKCLESRKHNKITSSDKSLKYIDTNYALKGHYIFYSLNIKPFICYLADLKQFYSLFATHHQG